MLAEFVWWRVQMLQIDIWMYWTVIYVIDWCEGLTQRHSSSSVWIRDTSSLMLRWCNLCAIIQLSNRAYNANNRVKVQRVGISLNNHRPHHQNQFTHIFYAAKLQRIHWVSCVEINKMIENLKVICCSSNYNGQVHSWRPFERCFKIVRMH